jgi:hypothetical protein
MKKYIGYALWLLALLIPFQSSLLSTSGVSNFVGLFSFLAFLALLFTGYALVDPGKAQASESHGH